jgi:hypothetical protein
VEAWELVLAFAGALVAGYLGSMLGLVLGTLRLPTGKFSENALRLALGAVLVVVGVAFALQAVV